MPWSERARAVFTLAPRVAAVTIMRMSLTRRHMLGLTAAFSACPAWASDAPIVFAAASLKLALDKIAAEIVSMRLSYGGSGALARQILQGAPADLFISANPQWMDVVANRALIANGMRRDLLGNRLVLIGKAGATKIDLIKWQPDGRVAMGFVEAVPSGQYGKAALQSLGVWKDVRPSVVEVENVRAALALVVRGELPYAIVYASDAMSEPAVTVLSEFAAASHPPITYPIAMLTDAGRPVYDAFQSPEAAAIFSRSGFEVL